MRVSRKQIHEEIRRLDPFVDETGFNAAVVTLASAAIGPNIRRLAKFTKLPIKFVALCGRRLRQSRVGRLEGRPRLGQPGLGQRFVLARCQCRPWLHSENSLLKIEKPLFVLTMLVAACIGWNYDIFGIWPKPAAAPVAPVIYCQCHVCTDTYCKFCSCKGKACGDEDCPSPQDSK